MELLATLFLLGLAGCAANEYWWYDDPNTLSERPTMVHLFEWKWTDIANECEKFLQYYGYGAVQVSPPMEHITLTQDNDMPWWVRYQPVSYKLISRSGNEDEFKDMVERCNKVGVRIIADVVLNHMVGVGQKNGMNGRGSSGGSNFDGQDGIETFPAVPFTKDDFNDKKCHTGISNYSNCDNVRLCRLSGLLDLNGGSEHVRSKQIQYLNHLVEIGVAGFRLDASKHMYPKDLEVILAGVKNVRKEIFVPNKRPFAAHEVTDIEPNNECVKANQYTNIGRYTDFNYGKAVAEATVGGKNFRDLAKMGPGFGFGNLADSDVLVFIDNHDNQRHGFSPIYKNGNVYKLAVGFMLGWDYGFPRVMSSFYFDNAERGPPNYGAGQKFATKSPQFNSDLTCTQSSGWVCEHRWPEIRRMAQFRGFAAGAAPTEIINTENSRIAFARAGKGYFALNSGYNEWNLNSIQTSLPSGAYCDVYSGEMQNGRCSGVTINVAKDGKASFTVPKTQFVAFHVGSRLQGVPAEEIIPESWKTTVILIKEDTNYGQNIFLRGGNNANGACLSGPHQQPNDPCAIPIAHMTKTPSFYAEYQMWSKNDKFFDFEGDEETQGTHDGKVASGTPLAYSTNDETAVQYQPFNTFGPGYWMVELRMDCSKTNNGWFEFKGYIDQPARWEGNIQQGSCTGDMPGAAPFSSINHIGRCGYINAFEFGSGSCVINNVPQ